MGGRKLTYCRADECDTSETDFDAAVLAQDAARPTLGQMAVES